MGYSKLPSFKIAMLKPKYWKLIIAVGMFKLVLCLPYKALCYIATWLAKLYTKLDVGKKRMQIAKRNIDLCFPDLSEQERNRLFQENVYATAMGIIETGMAWFWSDRRIKKWSSVQGLHNLKDNAQHGIILIGVHFLTLELGARIIGLHHPGIGIYRPNDNIFFDWIQTRGRLKSNKGMIDRNNFRGMLKAIKKEKDMIWFAPDHDYGRKNSVFVPFFAVQEAASTIGSYMLIKFSPASKVIPFAPIRTKQGYKLSIDAPVDFSSCTNEKETAALMNKIIEKQIMKAPEQYMWLHRRFKTRPHVGSVDLYK